MKMMFLSNCHGLWSWFKGLFKYNPIEDYLAQSVDRADYVARYKQLRNKGML